MLRRSVGVIFPSLAVIAGVAWYNRPSLPPDEEFKRTGLYSPKTSEESAALKITRAVTMGSVTAMSKLFIEKLNTLQIVENEHYRKFLELVQQGAHGRGRGLLTVSNHTSVYDDPILQSVLVGYIHPDLHRWGACKENICFRDAYTSSFTSAGKALPVRLGEGLEQQKFKALGRRLADGEWVHIYPEAACIQSGTLGSGAYHGCREEEKARKIGLLKWGVGKLATRIAFGENLLPPVVLPYYHVGMHRIKPQHNLPDNNLVIDPWHKIRTGEKIIVVFGPPISIEDLLAEYEAKIGKQRRLAHIASDNSFLDWDGTDEDEKSLYSKVTKRIEGALLELEAQAREIYLNETTN